MGSVARIERRRSPLFLLSLFLILFGARAALIRYAGNSTPFMDEWDGDAAFLLKPYLEGSLGAGDLVAPFNEHRILCTRLLALTILHVSGYWDVILQMILNAVIEAVAIVAASYALARTLSDGWAVAAMIAGVAINAIPYGYDNALLGFNTHFYLANGLSLVSLWLMADARAWSARWIGGAVVALASFLCMASGVLTVASIAAVHLLQVALGRRSGLREAAGIAGLAVATVALLALIPHVPESDAFRARSLSEFASALVQFASWPSHTVLGLVLFLPSALFFARVLRDRPTADDPRWFNVAALMWTLAAIVGLAAGRGQWPLQSRYTGVLLIGSMVNLTSAFWLYQTSAAVGRRRMAYGLALAAWLAFFALSLAHPQRHLTAQIDERRDIAVAEANNLRRYLTTGNAAFLAGRPALEIPYFDPVRLRALLDAPAIRAILPPDLTGRPPPRPAIEALKAGVLQWGFAWLGAGVALLLAVLALSAAANREPHRANARIWLDKP
jgi:hypothetical protein